MSTRPGTSRSWLGIHIFRCLALYGKGRFEDLNANAADLADLSVVEMSTSGKGRLGVGKFQSCWSPRLFLPVSVSLIEEWIHNGFVPYIIS